MTIIIEGRVWLFGDDINTDLIFPNRAMRLPLDQQHRLVFSANRPGWVDQVREGDIIVAGQNFGMGSGRPVGQLLANCGIRGVLANAVNGLCLRNCVSFGLPAISAPGVSGFFQEGDNARINFSSGKIENLERNKSMEAPGMPPLFQELVDNGGTIPMLVKEGWIEPKPQKMASI